MASTKPGAGVMAMVAFAAVVVAIVTLAGAPRALADEAGAQAKALKEVQRELRQLRADRARDRKLIETLEEKLDQVQSQDSQVRSTNQQLQATTQQLQNSNQQLQTKTDGELKQIQAQVAAGPTEPQIARLLGGYWGSHQFTLTGGAAVDYIYDHKLNQNTFTLDFEPIMLYRPTDWLAFEGTFEAAYDPGSGASFDAPVATAQIFLNDYMEAVLGIFDQPFGDFYETQGPFWVNRFITAPLPYGSAALVPPSDIGMQLRGAISGANLGRTRTIRYGRPTGPAMTPICRSRSLARRSTARPTSPPTRTGRHTAEGSVSIHFRSTATWDVWN